MAAMHRFPLCVKALHTSSLMLPAALRGGRSHPGASLGKQSIGPQEARGPRFMPRRWQTQASMPKPCPHTKHKFSQSPGTESRRLLTAFFRLI